jgi:DNA-binding GntR family transcriptional regulator
MAAGASGVITKEEFVTRRLREMVIAGMLAPGARLRQQQLALELGVSATPVREALRRLVSEGYLTSSPHVGVAVARPDIRHSEEIYEVRQRLEGYLAGLATARMKRDRSVLLRQLNDEFWQACQRQEYVTARLLNYRFHHLVWEAADRPVTLGMVEALWAKFPFDILAHSPGRPRRTVEEHERLIVALESGDAKSAEASIVDHIASGRHDFCILAETHFDAESSVTGDGRIATTENSVPTAAPS